MSKGPSYSSEGRRTGAGEEEVEEEGQTKNDKKLEATSQDFNKPDHEAEKAEADVEALFVQRNCSDFSFSPSPGRESVNRI